MNERLANDLIRYAELVEDGALISPEEMNCAALMRLAADALAQPEQEPVAWMWVIDGKPKTVSFGGANSNTPKEWTVCPLYTTPPQRERVLFPTMLRKMWSGGEVQEWLDVNVNDNK